MEESLKAQQFNPIDMMVGSGARGNMMQGVRQSRASAAWWPTPAAT